jgi:hypothetical protein
MPPLLAVMLENHNFAYLLARDNEPHSHLEVNHISTEEHSQGYIKEHSILEGTPEIIGIGPHPSAETRLPDDNFSKAITFGIVQRKTVDEESGNEMNGSVRHAYERAIAMAANPERLGKTMTPVEDLERVRFSSLLSTLPLPPSLSPLIHTDFLLIHSTDPQH